MSRIYKAMCHEYIMHCHEYTRHYVTNIYIYANMSRIYKALCHEYTYKALCHEKRNMVQYEASNAVRTLIKFIAASSLNQGERTTSSIAINKRSKNINQKHKKTKPGQPWTGPAGSRRLRVPDFMMIGTWKW